MPINALSGKAVLIVTGASRGIGKQISISFAPLLEEGSHVILLARDINGLKQTAESIPSNITVDYVSMDLGMTSADELKEYVVKCLKNDLTKFERLILVHNVGTVGDVSKKTNDATDFDYWRRYFDINLFSVSVLNGVMMKLFEDKKNVKKLFINISSIAAIQPMKCFPYYSTAKAARDMFFRVFASENPDVDVLNYSPGPVETDMLSFIINHMEDTETQEYFSNLRAENKTLTTEQTIKRLLEVLEKHKYKSGDHIDYYDEL